MITIYSLFWTIFNCSIMALIIFVLRTRTSFITKYGTPILYFLIICCIIRVLFPVEFPDFQYVIGDSTVYSKLCKPLISLLFPTFPDWFLPLLIFVWVCGSIFHSIRLYISSKDVQRATTDTSCEADGRVREKLRKLILPVNSLFTPAQESLSPYWPVIFILPSIFRIILTLIWSYITYFSMSTHIGNEKTSGRSFLSISFVLLSGGIRPFMLYAKKYLI